MQVKVNKILELIQQNELDSAERLFTDLKKDIEQIKDPQQIAQIGYQFAQLGFIDFCKQIYDQGERLFPGQSMWIVLNGELLMDDGRYEDALDYLLQVEADDTMYLDALLLQADAYQMMNWPEVSLVKLVEARSLAPEEPIVQYGIAELRFAQGDFVETLPFYKELLSNDKLSDELVVQIRNHYSYALAATGDYEEAIILLEEIVPHNRTLDQQNELAFYYLETEEFEKASTIYEELYNEGNVTPAMLALYAKVKDSFHDHEGAIALMDEALAENPYQPTLYLQKAELLIKTGNYQSALIVLDDALEADEEYNQAKILKLNLYLDLEDYDGASELVNQMNQEGIEEPSFFWLSAKLYNAMENYDQASITYRKSYQNMEYDEEFLFDYMSFLREEGDQAMVKQIFDKYPVLTSRPQFFNLAQGLSGNFNDEEF